MRARRQISRLEALHVLGLDPCASRARITRAYRRLALRYHPDRNRSGTPGNAAAINTARFREVAGAYAILEREFVARQADGLIGLCERCSDFEPLTTGLDGNRYCRTCVLTERGKRALPAPPMVIAGCGLTVVGLGCSAAALLAWLATDAPVYWWCSIGACLAGMLALVVVCLRAPGAVEFQRRRSRGRRRYGPGNGPQREQATQCPDR